MMKYENSDLADSSYNRTMREGGAQSEAPPKEEAAKEEQPPVDPK